MNCEPTRPTRTGRCMEGRSWGMTGVTGAPWKRCVNMGLIPGTDKNLARLVRGGKNNFPMLPKNGSFATNYAPVADYCAAWYHTSTAHAPATAAILQSCLGQGDETCSATPRV